MPGSWGEKNWRNAARNRDSWQKLLRKALAQKGLLCCAAADDDMDTKLKGVFGDYENVLKNAKKKM